MKKHKIIGLFLAAAMAASVAGCGGQGPAPQPDGGAVPPAQQEYQDALDRQEQAEQDAIQAEKDWYENNTKPYGGGGQTGANKGDGSGMAGLDDPSGSEPGTGQEPEGGGQTQQPEGDFQGYGKDGLPEGMPALTMEGLNVPEWRGQPWAALNGGTPYFYAPEWWPKESETYASLDGYRRPGSALAIVLEKQFPQKDYQFTVKAGSLSVPGFNDDAYPGVVGTVDPESVSGGTPEDGRLFYIRRLIGSGLGKLEQGRRNSLVCTQYMGEHGLKALEDAVLRYMERTGRRVIYRVTPIFEGKELVARGAVVEAMSLGDSAEDIGAGRDLCFNMFVYNAQPGVTIDYMTGDTDVDDKADPSMSSTLCRSYVLDMSRRQAHMLGCETLTEDVMPATQSFWYGDVATLASWSIDWNACTCMDAVVAPQQQPAAQQDEGGSAPDAGQAGSAQETGGEAGAEDAP